MVEYFDIVDDNDQPTGELTTKLEAHKYPIPHRVSAVLVFTQPNKILVQEHQIMGRLLDHSVGGHVSAGESYFEAAQRETKEELGLVDTRLEKVALSVPTKSRDPRPQFSIINHFYGVYKTKVPAGWNFEETEEVDSLMEMGVDEIIDDMNSNPEKYLSGFFITLNVYLKSINHPKRVRAYGLDWGEL